MHKPIKILEKRLWRKLSNSSIVETVSEELLICGHKTCTLGRYQSMEIDYWKINRSIDGNRLRLVNSHRLASANRWTIDNHRKVVVNYIDWHLLLTCYMFARVNVSFCSSPTTPNGVNLYWTLSSDVTAVTVMNIIVFVIKRVALVVFC